MAAGRSAAPPFSCADRVRETFRRLGIAPFVSDTARMQRRLILLKCALLLFSAADGMAAAAERSPAPHQLASSWRTVVTPAGGKTIVTGSVPLPRKSASPSGHALEGIASFYWQDQMTATGERFDKAAMTAAHRTLPFGTKVRVTHLGNGRSVVVRINDRGPFKPGRVIDLSKAAAGHIDMHKYGLARVRLEVVGHTCKGLPQRVAARQGC